jgi:diphthamide synthase (EF-2-diphthine--ammonia ligase)
MVLNAPYYKKRINLLDNEKVWTGSAVHFYSNNPT